MKPRPISSHLARLIWLCMTPLLLLGIWLAVANLRAQEQAQLDEGQHLLKNFVTSIDQHLQSRINALNMLAVSPLAADSRRWRDLYDEAQGLTKNFGGNVVFADTARQMLFSTNAPFGARLPMLPQVKGNAAAPVALATGQPAVGDTFLGPITKETMVAVAVPVLREGKVKQLMLSTFEARDFQQRVAQTVLPAGWSLSLVDGRGEVIARQAPPGFDVNRDEATSHRFVVRSQVSPWSAVLEIPHSAHYSALTRSLLVLGAGILAAALIGTLG
ncbi:MAG: cache domain-containing protein, partial [Sterolibacterium sp.]